MTQNNLTTKDIFNYMLTNAVSKNLFRFIMSNRIDSDATTNINILMSPETVL